MVGGNHNHYVCLITQWVLWQVSVLVLLGRGGKDTEGESVSACMPYAQKKKKWKHNAGITMQLECNNYQGIREDAKKARCHDPSRLMSVISDYGCLSPSLSHTHTHTHTLSLSLSALI